MGNQLSNEQGLGRPITTFGKRGALGLSKSELDKRCQSSGYVLCPNENKLFLHSLLHIVAYKLYVLILKMTIFFAY